MHYYAYGSNLTTRYLHDYCPSATFVRRADIPNFRVEFRRYSTDLQGGISSIIEAPGELVRGVIFEIDEAEIEALDILEDVPQGLYVRDTFLVLDEAGQWQRADLYRVANPSGPYAPAKQYIEWMIEGARQHELDAGYVDSLVTLRRSLD